MKESDTVSRAVEIMNRQSIGSVMVKSNRKFVGIVTERDILNRVVAQKLDPEKTLVPNVMTKHFLFINESFTLEKTMSLMTNKRVRHLPVLRENILLGMVSIGDVTRKLLEINQNEAESLRQYLFSSYSG